MQEVQTTCPYCGVGCGLRVGRDAEGRVSVRGDPEHPANYGRLCSKGAALAETLDLEGRLLQPEIAGTAVDWDQALDTVAQRFQAVIDEHGPDAVAFYVSGQLLTEDYYVANKLMKGFIGAANIDTNSRLCMSSAVAGYKRAFGTDTVPCDYADLEQAELIVITGSNLAWCHPVLFQRIARARRDNPALKVVVIDPRRTVTCDIADLHLAIAPGTDTALFNGLLVHLEQAGKRAANFVRQSTEGLDAALATAREHAPDVAAVASRCGLAVGLVQKFFRLFETAEKTVTLFSQGVNQFSMGTDKVNSIINCHLLTGRLGRVGMGPFSLTGQPNAMGGREVGGLANQLAAHLELEDPAHHALVREFWGAPALARQAGLKAVDLFEAVHAGRVKALWIMATNPAVSMPDSDRVRAALAGCEFLVVSDCARHTDTTAYAHVLLPATTWGERDGTVTNSERRISRQRPFLPAPGQARPDWWIISEVARRLGHGDAFAYENPAQIFREHAALATRANAGRDFDLPGLEAMTDQDYETQAPLQWPLRRRDRLFADGRFFTPSGKARFIPIRGRLPGQLPDTSYPLVLNTGRVRDHWHTLTRTGRSPRLSAHSIEPCVELHPQDAGRLDVEEGMLVRVRSRRGELLLRARLDARQRPGCVFIPMHWNEQFSSIASVDQLVSPLTDPDSGQPEFKYTPVCITPCVTRWHGFILSRRRLRLPRDHYWACARGEGFWRYELAGSERTGDWAVTARALLCSQDREVEWIEFTDKAAPRYRAARIQDGRLESCVFIGPDPRLPERDWLAALFGRDRIEDSERRALLSGRADDGRPDAGPQVCACFGVGRNTILEAIGQGCASVEALGARLKAGTNCGSCIPELRSLILQTAEKTPLPG
ncbi:MAG: molybdopterin-dependent oxidoreductase [Gammaproteobacteria bacterium]|nr:molybdopterin-dependent oxidoreductase [Gammaproteobacteria bacterium]